MSRTTPNIGFNSSGSGGNTAAINVLSALRDVDSFLLQETDESATRMIGLCEHDPLQNSILAKLAQDWLSGNDICVTQNFIALTLGARRESITEAAKWLQSESAIRYSRDHITVLDRDILERNAWKCYRDLKLDYERLFAKADE